MRNIKPIHAIFSAFVIIAAFVLINSSAVGNALTEYNPVTFRYAKVGAGTMTSYVAHGDVNIGTAATTGMLTLPGTTATDLVQATISSGNTNGVSIQTAIPGTDEVAVTLSGAPGASTNIDVLVIRPAN